MPMFKRVGVVVLAVTLAASCSSSSTSSPTPTPPPTTLVQVYGSVLDFKTNAGVPNATINFYIPPYDAIAGTAVTDEVGDYALSLPRGTYNPRINGTGPESNR